MDSHCFTSFEIWLKTASKLRWYEARWDNVSPKEGTPVHSRIYPVSYGLGESVLLAIKRDFSLNETRMSSVHPTKLEVPSNQHKCWKIKLEVYYIQIFEHIFNETSKLGARICCMPCLANIMKNINSYLVLRLKYWR